MWYTLSDITLRKGLYYCISILLLAYMDTMMLIADDNTGISLQSFNSGETYKSGESYTVTWDCDSTGSVDISLWNGGGCSWSVIASDISSAEKEYSFVVPDSLSGTKFRIKIEKSTGGSDMSQYFFIITSDTSYARARAADEQVSSVSKKIVKIHALRVWPVPAQDYITVESIEGAKILRLDIYDNNTKLLQSIQSNAKQVTISDMNFPAGSYYIKAVMGDGTFTTQQFILNK